MSRPVLIGLYLAWPLVIGVVRVTARVRRRFVLLSAAGWLGAAVIATTARPTDRALVAGLVCGVAVSLCGWLATWRGVTFAAAVEAESEDEDQGNDDDPDAPAVVAC